jgi:hypothetical protein
MKAFGLILIAVGVCGLLVALNLDTTMDPEHAAKTIGFGEFSTHTPGVPSQRVHNIGLMDQRRNWLTVSAVVFLSGIILFGLGSLGEQLGNSRKPI